MRLTLSRSIRKALFVLEEPQLDGSKHLCANNRKEARRRAKKSTLPRLERIPRMISVAQHQRLRI